MQATTFYSRLNKAGFLKKNGSLKERYYSPLITLLKGGKVRMKWFGLKQLDTANYYKAIDIANALNLAYKTGNDAPRGGKNGEYVTLTKASLRKVANISVEWDNATGYYVVIK